jgi:hypothetical protein
MRDVDEEMMSRITGLSGADWQDEDALEEALLWLTDPGTHEQMTEVERHLLPMALIAVRSARRRLVEAS